MIMPSSQIKEGNDNTYINKSNVKSSKFFGYSSRYKLLLYKKKEVITFIISQLQHVILTVKKFFWKFSVVELKENYSVVPDYK